MNTDERSNKTDFSDRNKSYDYLKVYRWDMVVHVNIFECVDVKFRNANKSEYLNATQ